MKKLTTQQKIILAVMIIVIFYGAYDFFLASGAKTSPADTADTKATSAQLATFVADLTAKTAKDSTGQFDAYVIRRAEMPWTRDPFYKKKSLRDMPGFKGVAGTNSFDMDASFNYSGYLDMGGMKMAIINDIEYQEGDPLETKGYVLKEIYPDMIVILNETNGVKFAVSLQD